MGTKTLVGCSVTPLVLTGAALAALVWGASTYVGLTREEVRLEQAWAQMENAWLHRRQLVPDLLEIASETSAAGSPELAALAAAADRAAAYVVTPELLDDRERCTEFLAAQARLAADVEALLAAHGATLERSAAGPVSRIRAQYDATGDRLEQARRRFNDAVAEYNVSLQRFPQRLVAPLFDFRVRDPWGAGPAPEGSAREARP